MTTEHPEVDCRDILFASPCTIGPGAEVALEDYARVLSRARAASVIGTAGAATGVHLCGAPSLVPEAATRDIEAFARELSSRGDGSSGLGWG